MGSPSLGDDYAAGEGGFARGGEKTVKVGFLDRAVGVIEHALEGATRGKALKEQYQWEAKAQWKGKPLSGSVAADITLYFGTKRSADWDNFHKLSCDALSGIAYEDDKQIKRAVVTVAYDKQNPRLS